MKQTIFAFAALLIVLTATGCNKDKNDAPATILGKWFIKTEHDRYYENGTLAYDTTYSYTGDPYFEFLEGTTVNTKDEDGITSTATYTYDDNTKELVFTEDGIPYNFTVTKLTSKDMTLHYDDTYSLEGTTYEDVIDIDLKK